MLTNTSYVGGIQFDAAQSANLSLCKSSMMACQFVRMTLKELTLDRLVFNLCILAFMSSVCIIEVCSYHQNW